MISTKDIPNGGSSKVSKTLSPGNTKVKVNSIYLEPFRFTEGAYNIMLDCEGVDMGPSFEGFFVSKDNESLGRHKGQVGRVRTSQWPYQDKDLGDLQINRDMEIVKFLSKFCDATGCTDWLEKEDGKHESIESLVIALNEAAPFADSFLNVCLAGREYENKQGYNNYDLFLPKFTKESIPMENASTDDSISRVTVFDKNTHIIHKKESKEVSDFSAANPDDIMASAGKAEFEL